MSNPVSPQPASEVSTRIWSGWSGECADAFESWWESTGRFYAYRKDLAQMAFDRGVRFVQDQQALGHGAQGGKE